MTGPTLPLAHRLAAELDGIADVEIEATGPGTSVWVTPFRDGALAVVWLDFGEQVILQIGEPGGRWELGADTADLQFLEDLVRSVIAGRVSEVFAFLRSRVTVTMPDGSTAVETGYDGLAAAFPLPLWPRWSRTIQYLPYE